MGLGCWRQGGMLAKRLTVIDGAAADADVAPDAVAVGLREAVSFYLLGGGKRVRQRSSSPPCIPLLLIPVTLLPCRTVSGRPRVAGV